MAFGFATGGLTAEEDLLKLPVLFEIDFSGGQQFFHLNSEEYSSYPYEEEVLLQEGIQYRVINNSVENFTFTHEDGQSSIK